MPDNTERLAPSRFKRLPSHGGGIRGADSSRRSPQFEGVFGRMFRTLPAADFPEGDLTRLAAAMTADPEAAMQDGKFVIDKTTGFIDAHIAELAGDILPPDAIAAAAEAWSGHAAAANVSRGPAWNDISGWSLAGLPRKDISAIIANGIPLTVEVAYEPEGRHVAAMTGDGTHIPANGRRARASFFGFAGPPVPPRSVRRNT